MFFKKILNVLILLDEFILRPTVGIIGRNFFGNNAGVIFNIIGNYKLNKKSLNLDQQKLKIDGFVRFDKLLSKDECEFLIKEFNKNDDLGLTKYTGDNELKKNAIMFTDKTVLINFFNNFVASKSVIKNLLENYYKDSKFNILHLYLQKNIGANIIDDGKKNYFSNQWHTDQFQTSRIKFFVYLRDVQEKNGPLKIINREQTKLIMRKNGYINRRNINQKTKKILKDLDKTSSVICKAGTVAVINATQCLHRASIPSEKFERITFAGELSGYKNF